MSQTQQFFTTLPTVSITTELNNTHDVLVIGLVKGDESPNVVIGANLLDDRAADKLDADLATIGATGDAGEIWRLPAPPGLHVSGVLAVGLGEGAKAESSESVRRAAGVAARHLTGVSSIVTTLGEIDLQAAAEGFILGAYNYSRFFTENKKNTPALTEVAFLISPGSVASQEKSVASQEKLISSVLDKASIIAESVALARDFTNTPSNYLYPESYAEKISDLAQKYELKVEILDVPELTKEKFGGILSVGQGSDHTPRLVRLTYKGKGKKIPKVALVGKGITFDSGGLSLKPPKSMETMTCDMAGSAAMVASIIAAARLKLPLTIIATLPLAENMPSAHATRPGDVITHYGGTTSEVLNTDAEGRLILADALVRAIEDKPDYLIEASTLTGAQVVALGSSIFAIMGQDEFRDRFALIATETDEKAWAMPLPEELKADLKSRVADIANISSIPEAGMLIAGLYLQHFVPKSLPWVHLDIAGPSFNTRGPHGYTSKGGTGIPVRSIIAALSDIAQSPKDK